VAIGAYLCFADIALSAHAGPTASLSPADYSFITADVAIPTDQQRRVVKA